jgi:hypothetical protein
MVLWLIILGSALAGGLLVLHAFGKAKEVRERILDVYEDLLNESHPEDNDREDRRNEEVREDAD